MRTEDIKKLREYCEDFKKFRDNTVDGDGNNLHDIKNTFDYVANSVEQYNLSGTTFGANLATKAKEASNVLSQLWNCFNNLEISIEGFCLEQEKNNSGSRTN